LADKIVSRGTNLIIMEIISSCPVCGKSIFSPFLKSIDFFLTREQYTIVSCDNCGMKFVNPRPDAKEIDKYYESTEYMSHDAKKKNILTLLYKLARYISIKKKYKFVRANSYGKKLLDIGCGTGEFIFYCRKKGFDVSGIEPGIKPANFARSKYLLEVYEEARLDILSLPEFDVITLWHVLEHVHLLHERMNKIVEIMKPGGTLIIAVPNSDSWDAFYYGKFWAAYDLPRHLYHFSQETMEILARMHSLKIEKIIPMKLDAFYISLLSEKYAKGKPNYFKMVINGIRSNNFAKKNGKNYSSLIFILKKEKN
jgi:2-polyprenyl-3-methyl-5-hydroxy-6-metoxy-1,4-benzoquinol methylase